MGKSLEHYRVPVLLTHYGNNPLHSMIGTLILLGGGGLHVLSLAFVMEGSKDWK